ncbi:Ribosomal RNA small subunit methyltransferase E [bacterium HR15]|nr:Ribosomal RNA small subunit methyltransferase E [bacterium HR15]
MGRRRISQELSARALPRFFIAPEVLSSGVLPPEVAHQVRHVLRLREGDALCLLDGTGWAHYARLKSCVGRAARFELVGREQLTTELPVVVVVLQALVRNEKAEQVVRLCTAAGARQLLFAPSERSLMEWSDAKRLARQQRWQAIAREEAELACRALCPTVEILSDWWSAIEQLPEPRLLLDEWGGVCPLGEAIDTNALSLIVGPEGGFALRERERMIQQYGCMPVSLGVRVLRTETAAFYALAQIEAILTRLLRQPHENSTTD